MKKIILSLVLFIISFAVLAYLRIFEIRENVELVLVWTSLILLVYTVFETYLFYRKRGYTINPKFQVVNTIILFATIFFYQKFLLKNDFIDELFYNIPLCLMMIIFSLLAFLKLTDKKSVKPKTARE